jgi:hypothetical protein
LRILLLTKSSVIPAWMPESRHTDVNGWITPVLKSNNDVTGKLPSLALDTRFPAGMTTPGLFRNVTA